MNNWNPPRRMTEDIILGSPPRESGLIYTLRLIVAMWPSLKGPWWIRLISIPLALIFGAFPVSSRTTGTRITAAIWNADIVDNMATLKAMADVAVPYDLLAKVALANSTTETTLATKSVTASTIGANGMFVDEGWIDLVNTTGGSRNFTLRFKLGATTIFDPAIAHGGGATTIRVHYKFMLINNNSASSQIARLIITQVAVANSSNTTAATSVSIYSNTAAEDTATTLTHAITMQMSIADPAVSFVSYPPAYYGPFLNA